jgi:hypothetical protein
MGIGLVVSILSMVAAGVLDIVKLRDIARHGLYAEDDTAPISIFWQIPPMRPGRLRWGGTTSLSRGAARCRLAEPGVGQHLNDLGFTLVLAANPFALVHMGFLSLYMSDGGGVDTQ